MMNAADYMLDQIQPDLHRPGQEDALGDAEVVTSDATTHKIYHSDTLQLLKTLAAESVDLVVTSPPYNVGKEYETESPDWDAWRVLMRGVLYECHRLLVEGGRIAINTATIGRKPECMHLPCMLMTMASEFDYILRGEVIWDKGAARKGATAWGSWRSPSNPVLRDNHEYITIFSKGSLKHAAKAGRQPTISREDFMTLTESIWRFETTSAKAVGHPAPYPVELPRRLIELYTYAGDTVLDPFVGSGTTMLAAKQLGRNSIGIDISAEYCQMAKEKLQDMFDENTFL